ncbi:hypothetical protein [Williamsia sp. CHRR-6]|uniref:hypothetical protein n=1 Tax=Williamsia sp. CHRR-6 TaxID=2835871 RepID=UPI001BDA7FF6|nr:hypothetical protein [Williamsia sp. CHRR-6]MBT0567390.1 hypothetical protein [Williamsia sp. CHRR-6]
MRWTHGTGAAVAAMSLALTLGVTGCGSDGGDGASKPPAGDASSSVAQPVSPSPPAPSDVPASEAPGSSEAPAGSDPDAETVPGPNLPPAQNVPPGKQAPVIAGIRCDTANGPEGALRVIVFPGSRVGCAVVMPVARSYGPLISTGRPQQVAGWSCDLSSTPGVLARCARGGDSFGFVPQ